MMVHIFHVSIVKVPYCLCVILHIKYVGNDGDVIANLPPMMYNLSVVATSNDVPPQSASDFVGPVTLTNGSAQCKCNIIIQC